MPDARLIPFLICTCIILSYFLLIIINAVNIPIGDDLYCLLLFTQSFQDADSYSDRFHLVFEQWVEHRIIFSRLTALCSFWILGEVNFKFILLIGNCALVGITLIFYKLLQKSNLSLWYLIPVVLTLCSPVMYEGNLWAGASTVYMPVCFLGMLSLYLLTTPSRGTFVLAVLTTILATYSFGNGMFTFVAGLVVLLYLRKNKLACIWMLAGFLATGVYFKGLEMHSATDAFGFRTHFRYPDYLFYNLFTFVGGIFNYQENVNGLLNSQNIPAVIFGLILSFLVLWKLVRFLHNSLSDTPDTVKAAWIGIAIFVGITSIVIAYSRTYSQQMTTISSRYKIYSMVAFLLLYTGCLISMKRKKPIGVIFTLTSAILLIFNYYVYYEKLVDFKVHSKAGLYNYLNNGKWVIYNKSAYYEGASKLICDSIRNNPKPVFHFEPVFPELNHNTIQGARHLSDARVVENTNSDKSLSSISVMTNEFPKTPNLAEGVYLVLYSKKDIFLFPAHPLKNGRANMLLQGKYFKPGTYLEENFHKILQKGETYKLAIFSPTEEDKVRLIDYQVTEN